jgi:hypothetical protein
MVARPLASLLLELSVRLLDAYRPVAGAFAGAIWNINVTAQANSKPAAAISCSLATAASLPAEDDAALATSTGAGL